ncbi:hypothetical protein BD408DRAFT_412681 [Parasitella parasitica]|nr:hypothetical protein BD408DRAFT_412681 [Parasitella parasitica]
MLAIRRAFIVSIFLLTCVIETYLQIHHCINGSTTLKVINNDLQSIVGLTDFESCYFDFKIPQFVPCERSLVQYGLDSLKYSQNHSFLLITLNGNITLTRNCTEE